LRDDLRNGKICEAIAVENSKNCVTFFATELTRHVTQFACLRRDRPIPTTTKRRAAYA
jgi:hypothetical protein